MNTKSFDQLIVQYLMLKCQNTSEKMIVFVFGLSVVCTHGLVKKVHFSHTIYWPGDHFDPKEEFDRYKDYDLVMPWVGLEDIPSNFGGEKFLSSTCAGKEFMNFHDNQLLNKRFDTLTKYKNKVSYIGGLSWERIDFELLNKMASTLENTVFFIGCKI